jgi:alpha-glucosidase
MGTRCHMLAMYVVLENYQGMVCDYPDAYIAQPGFEVLQHMPVTWDETRVTNAEPGKYISIARRKNNSWYIGTITDSMPREIEISLRFLPPGAYRAEIYSDAEDADENANHLTKKIIAVTRNKVLKLKLAPGGGNIVIINKFKNKKLNKKI